MDRHASRGSALFVAVALLMLVSAIGLGLVLTTSLEPPMAAAHESALVALYAAEAGLAVAVTELQGMADWDGVLSGTRRSAALDGDPDARMTLPDGTTADVRALSNSLTCGHPDACSAAEMDALTTERPWGSNNPRWQAFGHARLDQLPGVPSTLPPCAVVVWVADDPAEMDGNPLRDSGLLPSGARAPGGGLVTVRVDGFAARGARRTLLATVGRPRWDGDPRPPVVAWREVR